MKELLLFACNDNDEAMVLVTGKKWQTPATQIDRLSFI
jgi:hypothetical protein